MVNAGTVKIPCKDCITLATCIAKSKHYDTGSQFVEDSIFMRCIRHHVREKPELLLATRWFLRPDLKFTSPTYGNSELIHYAKVIYNENTM